MASMEIGATRQVVVKSPNSSLRCGLFESLALSGGFVSMSLLTIVSHRFLRWIPLAFSFA
jgi:hypothetical protein